MVWVRGQMNSISFVCDQKIMTQRIQSTFVFDLGDSAQVGECPDDVTENGNPMNWPNLFGLKEERSWKQFSLCFQQAKNDPIREWWNYCLLDLRISSSIGALIEIPRMEHRGNDDIFLLDFQPISVFSDVNPCKKQMLIFFMPNIDQL